MGFYQQGRNQCRPSSGDHISKQALRFRQDVIWSQKSEKIKKKGIGILEKTARSSSNFGIERALNLSILATHVLSLPGPLLATTLCTTRHIGGSL